MDGRLIFDEPADGAWNMAVDEALLEWVAESRMCVLRFYGWTEPTLSLGYFQAAQDRLKHAASRSCPWVRRSTGGGAIIHDRELTYSIAMPQSSDSRKSGSWLYDLMHQSLVDVFKCQGIHAQLCDSEQLVSGSAQAFLCFKRRSLGDVLIRDTKICGSAQRKRLGALVQHGSVLLARSESAPELHGVREESSKEIHPSELAKQWRPMIQDGLSVDFQNWSELPKEVFEKAAVIRRDKYASESWNYKR